MKKILAYITMLCFISAPVVAKCSCSSNHSHNHCNHSHSSSSSHDSNYLVNTEYRKEEQKFQNCSNHYAITEIRTDYYSNGQRHVYKNSTIYNSDGTILIANCRNFEHIIYNNKHYFIVQKDGKYGIYSSFGKKISNKNYSRLKYLKDNRILACIDKKCGIIDLEENIVVAIKYQKLINTGKDVFITKLNRYYGLIDVDNNVILKNNCEKIKQKGEFIVVKKYKKYGLYSFDGKKILDIKHQKIKILNGYILLKKDNEYGAINIETGCKSNIEFKKIKAIRNTLYGFFENKESKVIFEL